MKRTNNCVVLLCFCAMLFSISVFITGCESMGFTPSSQISGPIFTGFVLNVVDPATTGTPYTSQKTTFRVGETVAVEIHNNTTTKVVNIRILHNDSGHIVFDQSFTVPGDNINWLTTRMDAPGLYTVMATSDKHPSSQATMRFNVVP